MRLSTQIRKGGLKELVLRLEEPGQLREWRWGVFHLRGHKDVPLVTLQFCCRRIRRRSYARSVTVYTGDPAGWQPGLAIDVASLVTSARIAWAKGVAQKPLAPARVYALVPGEPEGGSEVVTGTAPILGFEASVLFDSGATHSFVSIVFVRLSRLVVRTLEPGLAVTTL
jgi:hypothetical protein